MQVELNNTTKKLCVIGDPVLHSKSPLIQNTMIQALGLDYVYLCQPVRAGEAARWLECARFSGYAGFNATMPHKEDLLPLMDELDEDARLYGSVNTVCIKDNKVYGYNTDGRGFFQALLDAGFDPRGRRVVLLGAGGAAKAVSLKLAQQGAASVTICNRTVEKAQALCGKAPKILSPAGFDMDTLQAQAASADLLVNCTSRPPSWLGPGNWATPLTTAWACSSTRPSLPWSTSPASPSTPRPWPGVWPLCWGRKQARSVPLSLRIYIPQWKPRWGVLRV